MSPLPEEWKKKIDQAYQKIDDVNYFELLGIEPREFEQGDVSVTKRFRDRARTWHTDRFNNYDLSEEQKDKLRYIFSKFNEAHQVLKDPDSRKEYLDQLRGDDDDELGVNEILDSEQAFLRGKNTLQTGDPEAAYKHFERAVELNPNEPQYEVYHKFTQFLLLPKDRYGELEEKDLEAKKLRRELQEYKDRYHDRDWMLLFLGVIAQGFGKTWKAKRYFRRAKGLNPDNLQAKRRLRLLKMREEREQDEEPEGVVGKTVDQIKSWFE